MVLLKLSSEAEERLQRLHEAQRLPVEIEEALSIFLRTESSIRAIEHDLLLSIAATYTPPSDAEQDSLPPYSFALLVQGAEAYIPLPSSKVRFLPLPVSD
jgi:hypothetical protein